MKKKTHQNNIKSYGELWLFLVVIALALLAYSNSFNVPFQFDDDLHITHENIGRDIESFKNFDHWINLNNRALSTYTIALNYHYSGENVGAYHRVNMIVHLLAGLFLWLLGRLLFRPIDATRERKNLLLALLVGVFLLHPLQTQGVTYIVQRMTSMAALFFIGSMWLYVLGRQALLLNKSWLRGALFLLLAALSGIAGVLSKQNAAVFPLSWLLLELYFLRSTKGRLDNRWSWVLGLGILIFGFLGIRMFYHHQAGGDIGMANYVATQLRVIPSYIRMFFLPYGLSIDHLFRVSDSFLETGVVAGSFLIISLLIFAFMLRKKNALISFGILFFFIAHLVESSFLPIADVKVDHRMYLPMVGLGLVIVGLVLDLMQRITVKGYYVFGALIVLSFLTHQRNEVWKTNTGLWQNVVDQYPESGRGWMSLAKMQLREKKYTQAIKSFNTAIQYANDDGPAYVNLGYLYMLKGDEEKSVEAYQKAMNNDEYRYLALYNLGSFYIQKKNYPQAIEYLSDAIESDKKALEAKEKLLQSYFLNGNYNETIEKGQEMIKKNSTHAPFYYWIGSAFFQTKNYDAANGNLARYYELDQTNQQGLVLYANVLFAVKDYRKAEEVLTVAYNLRKDEKILPYLTMVRKYTSVE